MKALWAEEDGVDLYDGVIDEEPRAAGGHGSGFFGHAGRPGEVGGSSSGEVGAPTDALKKLTEGKGLTSGLSRLSPSELVDKRGRALGSLGNPVVLYHYDVEDLR